MSASLDELSSRLRPIGQEHVLRFWRELGEAERAELASEVEALDLPLVERLAQEARAPKPAEAGALSPPRVVSPADGTLSREEIEAARRDGEALLRDGRVAFVMVAGGQATRLGIDAPKGTLPIGPVSKRSLFGMHADRVRAIGRRAGRTPLWFVLTSPMNHRATERFFVEQGFFGLPPERVALEPQGTVPAFDRLGRLVLASRSRLFRNPDGHGGSLLALARSGFLHRCRAEGADQLFYFQVDNPLARLGEPLFLGLHARARAGMSSKVVAKRDAGEKVGVLALRGGRVVCVEYSDLPASLRDATDAKGRLLYRAGNIAIHALSVPFVESLTRGGLALPWHRAEKKVAGVRDDGTVGDMPGVKFETFVFDALARSESSVTLEVDRADEFAPVKNAEGDDSPATARRALCAYFERWLRKAGLPAPPPGPEGYPVVEVHPHFAFDFAEFQAKRARVPAPSGSALYVSPDLA
ncbi:MAG TPA: UTP--glucose-1-phosphate uridylyltransferase [Planctomycetota bacterium]|nr:UTP--glucose-1-phosphate uridylyltransferase [Planctomycetota bacterium]